MLVLGLCVVLSAAGTIAAIARIRHVRRRAGQFEKLVLSLKRTDAINAHQGRIRLEGRTERDTDLLTSPVHGSSCVVFRFEVQELEMHNDWKTLYSRVESVSFRVVDDTGTVVVHPEDHPELELELEAPVMQLEGEEFSHQLREQVRALDIEPEREGRPRQLRLIEWRLDPGDACTVVGEVLSYEAGGGLGGYREAAAAGVLGPGEGRLVIADRSGDEVVKSLKRELSSLGFSAFILGFTTVAFACMWLVFAF